MMMMMMMMIIIIIVETMLRVLVMMMLQDKPEMLRLASDSANYGRRQTYVRYEVIGNLWGLVVRVVKLNGRSEGRMGPGCGYSVRW